MIFNHHKRKGTFTTGLILFLFLCGVSYSQNVKVLNLTEAISLAQRYNSDLINVRYEKLKAEEKVSEVYSENLVPTLTLSSQYTRAIKQNFFTLSIGGQTQRIAVGTDNTITTTLSVTEAIPVLGTPIMSGIKIAEYYSRLQDEMVNQVEHRVKTDVTKAFLNVLLTKEVVNLNQLSLNNAQENLRVVEARFRVGTALEFDYLRAKVRVETIRPNLIQAEHNFEISKKFLRTTIGLKDNRDIDVAGSLDYDSTEVFGSVENILNTISDKNVAIRQLRIGRSINEELVRVSKANLMPKFYLFGQIQNQAAENDGKSFFKFPFFTAINAGIGMSWDLNIFKTQFKVNQSEIDVKKTDETIADVREKLKTQGESILLRLQDAKNRITAQKENVEMAERGLELANISFKSGVINQIDVFDAELLVNQVRLGYVQAIYDYLNARTELEQLLEK
ncbi:MAG: TolC family protein [Ignavibacteriae bacterium]|nr:MAG: TolC family protein [Ignavibacteriota bacterium]